MKTKAVTFLRWLVLTYPGRVILFVVIAIIFFKLSYYYPSVKYIGYGALVIPVVATLVAIVRGFINIIKKP